MNRLTYIIILFLFLVIPCTELLAVERFPPPEFESHTLPQTVVPAVKSDVYQYVDVAVLLAALSLASYLAIKKRSRRGLFILTVFSLIYFGFWRKGCICPIGSVQNVTLTVFDSGYAAPLFVLLFFLLPLIFTLFFGRTFCAAVCPLGAIQDVFLLRPVSVPRWLESSLRVIAYIYLGIAILLAATGSAFIICRYDPFISFFRRTGSLNMLVLGMCFLIIGFFIGRPYCRFFCPYGIILRQLSRVSRHNVTITPDECIKCRLCENACPFGSIQEPSTQWPEKAHIKNKNRLAFLLILLPVLIFAGGFIGKSLSGSASRVHVTVRLAERIYAEDAGLAEGTTDASTAFRGTGKDVKELYGEAASIKEQMTTGGWFLGAFIGLVIGLKLTATSIEWQRTEFQAERADCFACGRCYKYCPKEHVRIKTLKQESS
ncbi:MAG: 4Fe-4S binding protein [Planctomycetota bacterium]|jgi:polyferredoxin